MQCKGKFSFLCVALTLMFALLSGCSESAKSEGDIVDDLQHNSTFSSNGDLPITDYNIIKRQTDVEGKTDDIYINVEAENDCLWLNRSYVMTYGLYNEGWILDNVTTYHEADWKFRPLQGVDDEIIQQYIDKYQNENNSGSIEIIDRITDLGENWGEDEVIFQTTKEHLYGTEILECSQKWSFDAQSCEFIPSGDSRQTDRSIILNENIVGAKWENLARYSEMYNANADQFDVSAVSLNDNRLMLNITKKDISAAYREGLSESVTSSESIVYTMLSYLSESNEVGFSLASLSGLLYDLWSDDDFDNNDYFVFDLDNPGVGKIEKIYSEQPENIFTKGITSGKSAEEEAEETAITITNGNASTNYNVGEASYFYHSTNAYLTMRYWGSYLGYDSTKSPADQFYNEEGKTFHDYFLEAALSDMTTVTVLYDASLADRDNGVTAADVEEDVDAAIDSVKQAAQKYGVSYEQYLAATYSNYVSPSIFEDCVTRRLIASEYQSRHQDSLDYTTTQLTAYYDECTDQFDIFQYSYLYFTPTAVVTTDADGNDIEMTDGEKAAAEEESLIDAKAGASEAMDALKYGISVETVIEEFAPTSYGVNEEDQGSSLNTIYGEWLQDSVRKKGDVTLIENDSNGFYVVIFQGRYLDEAPTVDTRHILIKTEMDEDAGSPTEEQMATAKARAEDLLNQWKAGAATEKSFAELANANSDDDGSNTNGGLYEKVYRGQFVTCYDEWLFDSIRQPGDIGIVENQGNYYGYHVVYYVKQNKDYLSWMAQCKESLADEDTENWLEKLESDCIIEQANGVRYLG